MPLCSIIICTRNRYEHLRQTLDAFEHLCVPEDLPCELIVVDNASTDETVALVQSCRLPNMPVRYILESKKGLSHARNAGVAAAHGEIIMFTDDDIRPPQDWIARMCTLILSGDTDAVAGGVRLAPHLLRSWMAPNHQAALAATLMNSIEDPEGMVGANMAFSRKVLAQVPTFDTEIGPGFAGCGEEWLFSAQVKKAGYRLIAAPQAEVEHHFEPERLLRSSWLRHAAHRGAGSAYGLYHWHHQPVRLPRLRLALTSAQLAVWRACHPSLWRNPEGIATQEMHLLTQISLFKQYLIERKRPRNYERHGLVKRNREAHGSS